MPNSPYLDEDGGQQQENGEVPMERPRGLQPRSREELDRNRKDLLLHILNRAGEDPNSEDEEKELNGNEEADGNIACFLGLTYKQLPCGFQQMYTQYDEIRIYRSFLMRIPFKQGICTQ